jgi:malonyl CoA-acyl carrier protein transacylase
VPVVDNTEAAVRREAEVWPDLLARHLVEPVRWRESQVVLSHDLGATELVELAPAGTLTAMAKRTIDEVRPLRLDDLLAGVGV